MWPYRHVFRAAHATQRRHTPHRPRARLRQRNATHAPHGTSRAPAHIRALCDTSSSAAAATYRRPRVCTLDILIHSLIHTDYIIGLYHADRPRDWRPAVTIRFNRLLRRRSARPLSHVTIVRRENRTLALMEKSLVPSDRFQLSAGDT